MILITSPAKHDFDHVTSSFSSYCYSRGLKSEQCDKNNENSDKDPSHIVLSIAISETGEESLQLGKRTQY